jgi:hypothetical protein
MEQIDKDAQPDIVCVQQTLSDLARHYLVGQDFVWVRILGTGRKIKLPRT